MTFLLASSLRLGSGNLGDVIVTVIILAALVAVALTALHYFGIHIPSVVWTLFWICLVAFLAILAVRFLLTL